MIRGLALETQMNLYIGWDLAPDSLLVVDVSGMNSYKNNIELTNIKLPLRVILTSIYDPDNLS